MPYSTAKAASQALLVILALGCPPASATDTRTPAGTIDAFHTALAAADAAGALSLLARDVIVFEYGVVDPTLEAYALQHLEADIEMAQRTSWSLETRQVAGGGDYHHVVSTYRVTGIDMNGRALDYITMESAMMRRVGERFRIVHLHWSTDQTR